MKRREEKVGESDDEERQEVEEGRKQLRDEVKWKKE